MLSRTQQREPYIQPDMPPCTDEMRLRFLITMMFRAVFHNRMLLDMVTVGLGKAVEGDKALCGALADVYELCEIQDAELSAADPERKKWSGIPPDSDEIEAAMKRLDTGVAKLLIPPPPKQQAYSFESRPTGSYLQRGDERGPTFRSNAPARLSND